MKWTSLSAIILAIGVCAPAFGIQIVEHFDNDPAARGFGGVNNMTAPQNYGFSNTDNTGNTVQPPSGGATLEGEMGGSVTRDASPANFYGLDLGGNLSLNDPFYVEGVLVVQRDGGSGLFLGYSNGAASYGNGGDPSNFIGVQFDDGDTPLPAAWTPGQGRTRISMPQIASGEVFPFSFDYDPTANGGNGAMDVMIGANSATLDINKGDYNPFTHFGIMAVSADGGTSQIFIDDLEVTAVSRVVIPEPSTLLLVICGALGLVATRRVR